MEFYSCFRNEIWWKYRPASSPNAIPVWILSDSPDGRHHVMYMNADIFRIDQAIDRFYQFIKDGH